MHFDDVNLFVTREDIRLHRVPPDVTVSAGAAWQPGAETAVTVAEPTMIELDHPDIEPRMQRHLRLIHRPTGQVVTVMELLSPINKASGEDGLEAYLEKRAEFLASGCHLIEFDSLRGGERLPMAGPLPNVLVRPDARALHLDRPAVSQSQILAERGKNHGEVAKSPSRRPGVVQRRRRVLE